jgi:hypothetical protein
MQHPMVQSDSQSEKIEERLVADMLMSHFWKLLLSPDAPSQIALL